MTRLTATLTAHLAGTAQDAVLEVDGAELVVAAGPDKGLVYPLGPDLVRIGTARECQLVLHDPTVSSLHAEITSTDQGVVLTDLESKNGVVVGPWAVQRIALVDGMQLKLGETVLAVRATGDRQKLKLAPPGRFGPLIAHSIKMRALVPVLERVASTNLSVLIQGETGVGKDVVARAIHQASPRTKRPFTVFDCGATSKQLMLSELFGHEKGAFTGASDRRIGAMERAEGGTLFLDEVGELPLDAQTMFLRALDNRTSRRVGGSEMIKHDLRVICATNRNLREEVKAGRFREDLYFRLGGAEINVPPLRDRPKDIPPLAEHFAADAGVDLPPSFVGLAMTHRWPGNARELRNAVERMAVGSYPEALEVQASVDGQPPSAVVKDGELRPLREARRLAMAQFEHAYAEAALTAGDGNVTRAAELAGVSRQSMSTLVSRMRRRK
ncbi:MAG: sigma 54-interacting transcriptional regulator [Deltaproteobacteria bacterium]|nr:sigma 54-interacting transcriptional regulator [Deltaproteobacteria bacterium]